MNLHSRLAVLLRVRHAASQLIAGGKEPSVARMELKRERPIGSSGAGVILFQIRWGKL
ncbi:MAG TPA: hypothetical protein VJW77_12140 [Terriglobia bacterium]|nr:hypothetical protein [Terriglobia bacterium]